MSTVEILDREDVAKVVKMARIKYDVLAKVLASGGAFAIKCKPHKLYRIKRRLSKMLGEPLTHVIIEDEEGNRMYVVLREKDFIDIIKSKTNGSGDES